MSDAELAELLSQVRAGDSDAWGELYRRYAPAIFRFCRRALAGPRGCRRRDNGNFHESAPKTRDLRFLAAFHRVAL